MWKLLKAPLMIAAVLLVLRIVLEQAGAPRTVNNIFGVTWLFFLVPVYFALALTRRPEPHPYKQLFKHVLLFGLITRLMIWPTYSLAYLLRWEAPRFQLEQGGVVGEGVGTLEGVLLIPLRNTAIGVGFALLVGMVVGSALIVARRRMLVRKAE